MDPRTERKILNLMYYIDAADLEDGAVDQTARILADTADGLDHVSPQQVKQTLVKYRDA